MGKRRISIWLMVLTIGVIVLFQVSWLRKNYEEEKKIFTLHTNLLFRETLFKMQVARLQLDTAADMHYQDKAGLVTLTNVLKAKVMTDNPGNVKESKTFIISLRHDSARTTDSAKGAMYKTANSRVFEFLRGVDSLQDSIPVKQVTDRYKQVLAGERISLPFRITVTPAKAEAVHRLFSDSTQDTHGQGTHERSISLVMPRDLASPLIRPDGDENKVMMGFTHPQVYQLEFDNPFWLIARRVGPQALFSFLLVGITIFSFLLLYRNWQQQRKLTALKNDFISNMTHELKTPIATVSVAVEALQRFNALQDPVRTQEYLDISAGELQRLSLLVDKVLRLSLFETQEIELKNDAFDLRSLAEEVMASMRLQFEKHNALPAIGVRGTDFSLRADKLHITSVIFNLLDNALKYSKGQPSIQVELVEEAEQLLLSVTDNGIGIPAAYKEKIFEKFFRVPTGDKHNVKGYGLGLSYVAYVLRRQGGRISVESQVGIGSRFTIQIPRNTIPFTPNPALPVVAG